RAPAPRTSGHLPLPPRATSASCAAEPGRSRSRCRGERPLRAARAGADRRPHTARTFSTHLSSAQGKQT
ncbi:hypothetical protein Nmel_013943, partial [Mimus melanotis]